jgi:hypothetical protein
MRVAHSLHLRSLSDIDDEELQAALSSGSTSRGKHSVPVVTSVTESDSGKQAGMRNSDRLHMKLKHRVSVSFETSRC